MKKHTITSAISVQKLEINRGQLYGLPKNPRFIRDTRFEALKKSIQDAPEMLPPGTCLPLEMVLHCNRRHMRLKHV